MRRLASRERSPGAEDRRRERGVPYMAANVTDCQPARSPGMTEACLRCTVGPNRLSSTRRKSTECRGWQQGDRHGPHQVTAETVVGRQGVVRARRSRPGNTAERESAYFDTLAALRREMCTARVSAEAPPRAPSATSRVPEGGRRPGRRPPHPPRRPTGQPSFCTECWAVAANARGR